MLDVLGVVYCVCAVAAVCALVVMAVIDVVEHFQFVRGLKFEIEAEIKVAEEKENEDNA